MIGALLGSVLSFNATTVFAAKAEMKTEAVAVENDADKAPDALVSEATENLIGFVKKATKEDKALGLSFYENLVEDSIGPFVDFKTIAFRVMGRDAYKKASEDQRTAFVEAFKRSLITTYAKGISTYDDQTVKVAPFEGKKTANGITRAKVEVKIVPKGGKPFPIIYSMYQDDSRGWLLENMHLDGVNVGSTFRNQFQNAYSASNGNIDKVIKNWGQSQ